MALRRRTPRGGIGQGSSLTHRARISRFFATVERWLDSQFTNSGKFVSRRDRTASKPGEHPIRQKIWVTHKFSRRPITSPPTTTHATRSQLRTVASMDTRPAARRTKFASRSYTPRHRKSAGRPSNPVGLYKNLMGAAYVTLEVLANGPHLVEAAFVTLGIH